MSVTNLTTYRHAHAALNGTYLTQAAELEAQAATLEASAYAAEAAGDLQGAVELTRDVLVKLVEANCLRSKHQTIMAAIRYGGLTGAVAA